MIDNLTEHGIIETGRVQDSPFTALAPEGPDTILPNDIERCRNPIGAC